MKELMEKLIEAINRLTNAVLEADKNRTTDIENLCGQLQDGITTYKG